MLTTSEAGGWPILTPLLLLKLLAKSREDRFASAEEILVAISARREADRAAREVEQVESSAA